MRACLVRWLQFVPRGKIISSTTLLSLGDDWGLLPMGLRISSLASNDEPTGHKMVLMNLDCDLSLYQNSTGALNVHCFFPYRIWLLCMGWPLSHGMTRRITPMGGGAGLEASLHGTDVRLQAALSVCAAHVSPRGPLSV
jgi:hypothetical protein